LVGFQSGKRCGQFSDVYISRSDFSLKLADLLLGVEL
jgi:hypothetical protein